MVETPRVPVLLEVLPVVREAELEETAQATPLPRPLGLLDRPVALVTEAVEEVAEAMVFQPSSIPLWPLGLLVAPEMQVPVDLHWLRQALPQTDGLVAPEAVVEVQI